MNILERGKEYIYTYTVRFYTDATSVRFGMFIKTETGVMLGGSSTSTRNDAIPFLKSGTLVSVRFLFTCSLFPGTYFVNAACSGDVAGRFGFLHRVLDAALFRVRHEEPTPQSGIVDFGIQPSVEILPETITNLG